MEEVAMLKLRYDTIQAITTHAMNTPELEVVGLVWEVRGVQTVRRLRNTHSDPRRYYCVDPDELRLAYQVMERSGGEPLAFYHSHPGGKSDPSEEDMLGALNDGMHYLIAYPKTETLWRVSAWECITLQVLVEDNIEVLR
jgi:proteasome lid subunit RPN8/RPN11